MAEDDDEEPGETESTASRYWLTNDVAAIFMVATMGALTLLGVSPWVTVPRFVFESFVIGFLIAVAWLFGKGAVRTILEK